MTHPFYAGVAAEITAFEREELHRLIAPGPLAEITAELRSHPERERLWCLIGGDGGPFSVAHLIRRGSSHKVTFSDADLHRVGAPESRAMIVHSHPITHGTDPSEDDLRLVGTSLLSHLGDGILGLTLSGVPDGLWVLREPIAPRAPAPLHQHLFSVGRWTLSRRIP